MVCFWGCIDCLYCLDWTISLSVFRFFLFVLSTPSVASLLVPPVSGGQSAGAVVVFRFLFVTNSPPETGASTP